MVGRYISVLRDDGTFTGGAHPNSYEDTILWDRDARKRINIRPLFRETADNGPTMTALARLARVAVAAEKIARDAINVDVPKEKLTPERLAELDQFIVGWHQAVAAQDRADLARASRPRPARARASPSTIRLMLSALMPKVPTPCSCPGRRSSRFCRSEGTAIFGGTLPESDKIP